MRKRIVVVLICTLLLPAAGRSQAFVKSANGDFEWRLIGRILMDAGFFRSDSTKLGNGVVLGDVRLGTTLRFLQHWTGKIEAGYAYDKLALKDTYIAYKQGNHTLKAGYYFEPFGTELQVSTAAYRLMNMATTSTVLGDGRKLGFTYQYTREKLVVVGGFFGNTSLENSKEGDAGYTLTAQVIGRPVYEEEKVVHIGLSAHFSDPDKETKDKLVYKGGAPSYVFNKEKNRFLQAEVTRVINEWRTGADVIVLYKRFYFQSECLVNHVNRYDGRNYTAKGVYTQIGCLFGGDNQYRYDRANSWVDNPNPKNIEVLFRYNLTDLDDGKAGIYGGRAQDITFGANYFFNDYVAAKLNYTSVFTNKHALNGKENVSFIQARVQLRF
ncbi:porin [Odoribacter lunatus]|uniref:porin n=1 Tax=Odoribacter lunatus TaxID=2941335 RepID=UPI00203E9B08|nr:porin [Odoribacter lunatus]